MQRAHMQTDWQYVHRLAAPPLSALITLTNIFAAGII